MKKLALIFSFLLLFAVYVFSQNECKVLLDGISGTYEGECKNGLAHGYGKATGKDIYEGYFRKGFPHGKGTYTWENGDVFDGKWKSGKRSGYGKYCFSVDGRDSTLTGNWKNDEYVVSVKEGTSYKVVNKRGISTVRFMHSNSGVNEVRIYFMRHGAEDANVNNILLQNSSGIQATHYTGFENYKIPFTGSIDYQTLSALGSVTVFCSFEFELYLEGSWSIYITNQ